MTTIIVAVIVVVVVIAAAVVIVELEKKPAAPSKKVEFYTWWATEGKVALDQVGPAFHNATGLTLAPYVSPGAGGSNAIYAILSLMEAGKPPATFQVHYGPAMLSYVEAAPKAASSFVNMGPVAEKMNLTNNTFPEVIQAGEFNGTLLSLPVDLHQGAQFYFNPQLLKKYDLPIPANMTMLVNDTEALHNKGVSAWIIPGGDGGWDQLNVWEDIFLGVTNNTYYDQMMYGDISPSQMPSFMHDFNVTNRYYSIFQNDSYSGEQSLTWTQAIPLLTGGTVAFQANGNWYTNYAYDYEHVTNYPAVAPYDNNLTGANLSNSGKPVAYNGANITLMSEDFPSTSKYYVMITDSVAVPTGSTQTNGLAFAKYFASFTGSSIFNKWKATSFYENLTANIYNTPAQYYSHEVAANTSSSDWVYQLSDGGLFAGPLASAETAMTTFSESFTNTSNSVTFQAASSILDKSITSWVSTEESSWMAANSLGMGYMGSPGHIFGGYLPAWANTAANRTASSSIVTNNTVQPSVNSPVQYVYVSPFSMVYLENFVAAGTFFKN